MSFKTTGKEAEYSVTTDSMYPVLCVGGPGSGGTPVVLPEKLVKQFRAAEEAFEQAAEDIVRWVKYSRDEEAKAELSSLIDRLPAAAERKKR